MLLRLFKGAGPAEIFFIGLTGLLVWAYSFLHPQVGPTSGFVADPMPLYNLLQKAAGQSPIPGVIFSFSLVILMASLLVNFNTSQFFINERTFLPGVLYILITGLFPGNQVLNPVLPASVFLMIAIRRIMNAYRLPGTAYHFFDGSLLIGTGSLFYANLIWFALLVFIGIAILRTISIKELVISVVGLITPALITMGIWYAAGKDITTLLLVFYNNLFSSAAEYSYSTVVLIGLMLPGIIALISLFYLFSVMNIKKIKSRKTFTELSWTLAIAIAVYLFVPSASNELIWIAAIPLSYIMAHYFIFIRKKIFSEIFFAILMIVVAFLQIWNMR